MTLDTALIQIYYGPDDIDCENNVLLCNSFVLSNLNYRPLILVFNGKSSNNEIRLHKHAMRVLLDDYGSTFE